MELRQLRYFLAVAEELHFGRAARRVHISQPPLSQQIRQLEEELQVQLFRRTRRKVELTEAGRHFAAEVRLILQQLERASTLASKTIRGPVRLLHVGCSPANSNVVVKILRLFMKQHQEPRVLIKTMVTPQQVEALRNGRIDLGFVTLPLDGEGLVVETLFRERLVVAMSKHHPLAGRRRIPLRALANDTQILFPLHLWSYGRYELMASLCRSAGLSLHAIHEVDNVYTMLELVRAGCGVSLVRASAQNIQKKGIVFRELVNSPEVETALAYRRENRSNVLPLFVKFSKQVIASSL